MARVKIANLNRLGEDARRQIRDALQTPSNRLADDVPPGSSKLHNVRTQVDGITFDSLDEAARYGELKLEERAGLIQDLKVHQPFRLDVNGIHICDHESDFTYHRDGKFIVDALRVKSSGTITYAYRIKKKLMLAIHGIAIQEVFQDQRSRRD